MSGPVRRAACVRWLGPLACLGIAAGLATVKVAAAEPDHAEVAQRDVRTLYLADCAVCHGGDGRGTDRGPSLVGVGRASLDFQLSTGRMPLESPDARPERRRPKYSPATVAALVDHVDGLTGGGGLDIPRVGRGDLAEGGVQYRLQCAACHAWAGDGGALLHREAPALHAATPTQIAEVIRVGSGEMPAFGPAALTDEQVDSVVAYVRYLDDPRDRGGHPLDHLGPVAEGAVALAAVALLILFAVWIGERG